MTATASSHSHPLRQPLLDALVAEYKALNHFIVLLQQEQRVLDNVEATDIEQFTRLTEEKTAQAELLESLGQKRLALVEQATGGKRHAQAMATLMNGSGLERQWYDFRRKVVQASQLNQANGLKLGIRADYNQRALRFLHNAAGMSLYGRNGQTHARGGSNLYGQA